MLSQKLHPAVFVELEPEVNDVELMNLHLLSQIALCDSLLEISTLAETISLESVTGATTQSIETETIPADVHMSPSDALDFLWSSTMATSLDGKPSNRVTSAD